MLLVVGWLGSQAQGWGVVWYGGGGTWAFSVQNQISAGGSLEKQRSEKYKQYRQCDEER